MSKKLRNDRNAEKIYEQLAQRAPKSADPDELAKLSVRLSKYESRDWDVSGVLEDIREEMNMTYDELALVPGVHVDSVRELL